MDKRKVIFDTDIGSDDAFALTSLLLSENIEVIGITTVFGNQPVNYTTDNALRLVEFLNKDIPVYKGCHEPMARNLFKGRNANTIQEPLEKVVDGELIQIHAEHLSLPETTRKQEEKHACSYLVETLRNTKEKLTICAVGPLTNLGISLTMDPSIVNNIDEIYIMGGGIFKGNRTPSAEANFYDDPEAAEKVLNSGAKVILAPLEACESMRKFGYPQVEELKAINNKVSNFLAKELDGYLHREQILFGEMCTDDTLYDLGAAIALIDNSLIKEMKQEICHIDCSGGMADGTIIADRRGMVDSNSKVNIIYELKQNESYDKFMELIKAY